MPEEEQLIIETPPEQTEEVLLQEAAPGEGEQGKKEIVDPGQNEGRRVHPDQSKVPPERFEQVYGKLKGAERKINEISEKLAEKEAVMEEVRKHNQALMDRLEKLSTKAIDAVEQVGQQQSQDEEPPAIAAARRAVEDLENRKEEALENLNAKEVTKIDRELRKVERIIEGYEYLKSQKQSKPQGKKQEKSPNEPPPPDPDIERFASENKWFGKDPIMTGAAKEYDFFLSHQPEWKDQPFSKRLAEVKRAIEAKFPQEPDNKRQSTKPQGAESGLGLSRASGPSGAKTVRLTEQQLAVARGLGISAEDYAKQLNFLGGAV